MTGRTRPCEVCGAAIDPERVEAIPETRLCADHARMIARQGANSS
jgi:RNA polymerase-binding transcription factor DksA